jgi:hypothetical protein
VLLGKGELSTNAYASELAAQRVDSSRFITTIAAVAFPETPAEAPAIPEAPVPEAPAPEAPPPEANRADCPAITGSDYLSGAEREWYIANCMTRTAQARLASVAPVATTAVAPAAAGGSVIDQFVSGYRDAGGPEAHLNRIVTRVIPCESGGNPRAVNYAGPYYGLMQFVGSTWRAMGGGDWFDPYTQGVNTARLLGNANPATQWPVCWHR